MTDDGTGPYLRVEVNIAAALVTQDDRLLNGDMVDVTLAFGRGISDGPAIAAGKVTSERATAVLAQMVANITQSIRVMLEQNLSYLETVPAGEAMTDHGEVVSEREAIGVTEVVRVGGKAARA